MKKSLIAMAVLAAASGAAMAQSSVTLFGIVDAGLFLGRGSVADRSSMGNSGYNGSRLGFRGVEDLGGGMKAGFWLEAGLANDDGQGAATNSNNQATGAGAAVAGRQGLTFNRRSTVSVGGGWGELRLGRDYTPQFWNHTVYDPFGTNGTGTSHVLNGSIGGPTTVRSSNGFTYLWGHDFNATSTRDSGGSFHAMVQTYLGENASNVANKKDGNGSGLRVGYNGGPLSVALGLSQTKYLTGNISTTNLAGAYDLGVAKLMGMYDRDRVKGGLTGKGYLVGATVPMGGNAIRVSLSSYKTNAAGTPKANKFALGYVHNLSKRTALYATVARVSNKGGAAFALNGATASVNGSSTGYDFGVTHRF